jgi:ssDNA-binding Zn-finger/Zn-ribbon topoisomerase 1
VSKPENVTCPLCDGQMVPRASAHGKFWGCKAYPKCRGTRNVMGDANMPRETDDSYRSRW